MTPELRAALYAAFPADEGDFTVSWIGRQWKNSLPETMTWEQLEELEDQTLIYQEKVFNFVLPRWLELLTDDEAPRWNVGIDTFVFILGNSRWLGWPAEQVEAVRGVFEVWRDKHLREGTMKEFADFVREVESDAARYLDVWVRTRPPEVAQWAWKRSWANPPSLRSWLVSPRVEGKLEEAFFRNPKGQHAQLLSDAIQLVRSLRALESWVASS